MLDKKLSVLGKSPKEKALCQALLRVVEETEPADYTIKTRIDSQITTKKEQLFTKQQSYPPNLAAIVWRPPRSTEVDEAYKHLWPSQWLTSRATRDLECWMPMSPRRHSCPQRKAVESFRR